MSEKERLVDHLDKFNVVVTQAESRLRNEIGKLVLTEIQNLKEEYGLDVSGVSVGFDFVDVSRMGSVTGEFALNGLYVKLKHSYRRDI